MAGLFISVSQRYALTAGLFLALCLCASLALANPPAKPKNPGPLDIPDSQVLKMSIDQYLDAYTKKHSGNVTELDTRTLCYYYAGLKRKQNLGRAQRLPQSQRNLVARCETAFGDLSQACEEYQYSAGSGTIIYDYYAMLDVENEAALGRVIDNLQNPAKAKRGNAARSYLDARRNLQKCAEWLSDKDTNWTPSKSEGQANYRSAKTALRKAKTVLDALPDSAKGTFAAQLKEITGTLNDN
jgi:hypothetical protein